MDLKNLCMGCMSDKGDSSICQKCGWHEGSPQESLVQLPPRTTLNNHYLLGKVLGQGGFGITYLGWDTSLERKLAIKEYFPYGLAARSNGLSHVSVHSEKVKVDFDYGLEKFLEEGKILARFQEHPGIVSVIAFFKANGTGYLVMEYVGGITLKEYIEQEGGRIPFETAVKILMPVMDALREVHDAGLLHRDISPDNIYITKKGQVKLLDFGAARHQTGGHSKTVSVILKHGFAPEEQYRHKGKQGPWTDVYALGITIYNAITGEVPPMAMDRLVDDDLKNPAKLGVPISLLFECILLKAIRVRAVERYQTVKEFQDILLERIEIGSSITWS